MTDPTHCPTCETSLRWTSPTTATCICTGDDRSEPTAPRFMADHDDVMERLARRYFPGAYRHA